MTISRVSASLSYPCAFMLAAAMNPCPCGYFGHPTRACTCTPVQQRQYLSRISAPCWTGWTMWRCRRVDFSAVGLKQPGNPPPSSAAASTPPAWYSGGASFQHRHASSNAPFPPASCGNSARLTDDARRLLQNAFRTNAGLSARAYDRLLKVARTIADLEGGDRLEAAHVAEAVQYRSLDPGKYWQAR